MKTKKETVPNLTKEQLQNRLYDQGFSPYTMPSVVRSKRSMTNPRPLVARLYSLNNNLVKEVKQPQTSILFNQSKSLAYTISPVEKTTATFQHSEVLNTQGLLISRQIPAESTIQQQKSTLGNSKSKFESGVSKRSQLQPIEVFKSQVASGLKENSAIDPNPEQANFMMSEIVTPNSEGQMLLKVVDKLRDKYLDQTKFYNMNRTSRSTDRFMNSGDGQISENKTGVLALKNQLANLEQSACVHRKGQKELDTYINLLTKNSPNIDEFVYLVRNPDSDDPYDLIMKKYFELEGHGKKSSKALMKIKAAKDYKQTSMPDINDDRKFNDYYTISIKGVCHFKNGRPVEFIGLGEWIKERETYDKIKNLSFFANFRKWKTLKIWSKNYKSFKQKVAKKSLQSKHFINYPEIREAILQAREVFYNMSQLKFLDFNSSRENQSEICDITQFVQFQEFKAQQTQSMIQAYSKEIHDIIGKAIETRLETLRNQITHSSENENFKKNPNNFKNNQIFSAAENPYEALSFPENMSYDKRSILRKECHRFVRFSFFVDFLAQEALRVIYIKSLKLFAEEIEELTMQSDPIILRELDKNKQNSFKEPMFQLQVQADLSYVEHENSLLIDEVELPDYKFPQITEEELKPEDYQDYSLLAYPFIVNYEVTEDFNEHQKKYLEYCEVRHFIKKEVNNIEKVVLRLAPSLKEFSESIIKLMSNGLTSLQAFNSFVLDKNMKKYFAVLEEWEEHEENRVSDFDNTLLNPEECIDAEERRYLEKTIRILFENQFKKSMTYLQEFKRYLQIDWEYQQLDISVLTHKNLAKPGMTLNAIINLLDYHKQLFETQIPYQADLGIFRIISKGLKLSLIEKPKQMKEKLSLAVPENIYTRISILKDWFDASISKLELNTTDIEVFVHQSKNLKDIEKNFGYYKDMLKTTKEVIETLKRFQIEFKKSQMSTFVDCRSLEQNLVNQLVQVNDNLNKNQEIFSRDIKENAIPSLIKECGVMLDKISDPKYLDIKTENVLTDLKTFEKKIEDYKEKAKKLNSFEEVLGLPRTRFEILQNLNEVFGTRILLWQSYEEWFEVVEKWRTSPFQDIQVEEIQAVVEKYQRNISRCRNRVPNKNEILMKLETDIKNFASMLPIVVALRNPKLTKAHYQEIEQEINLSLSFDSLLLQDLLNEQVLEHQKNIIGISVQVTQEANLKLQLNEIEQRFGELVFPLKPFKEDTPKDSTYILGDCEPLLAEVDRLIMMINNVYGSRYLKEYKKLAADKRKDILLLQELLVEWIKFQKSFIYLESIFSQPEIKKPLQLEVKEFEDSINKIYKQNMKKIMVIQSITLLTKQKYIELYVACFKKHNEVLHELNKKLNNFLDSKREAFPRFYFVSNDELVYILANYDSSAAVQLFIGKLFENVNRADFGSDPRSLSIQGLISREGEVLPLKSMIGIKSDAVEKWMKKLEDQMYESLHKTIKDGLKSYSELPRNEWYLKVSSQALSVITQIAWTVNVEEYLKNIEKEDDDNIDISDVINDTQKNLEILITLVRNKLSVAQHQAIVAIITMEVHNRDILEYLAQKGVASLNDFAWQQQLRFYYDDSADWKSSVQIHQINSHQKYGYEYYGPTSRIVVTPLTERCWITITSALQMKLGAAPAGPAGTGKTESVKDLAKSLGRFCVVFNCSDQIDYITMEKLFRGVIKQGAWTCLDEFNRIDIEVLSVIAQQLLEMRLALLTHKNEDEFFFCGARCKLNDTCGVFITMNPGYAGRTELPENLKALFRPISMMIPDYTLIAQILLFSEGFLESKMLASKMIKLYKLASEQLSQQKHYDFGMRAVKSVLEMAGRLKRAHPNENESILLIKALRDANLPKFIKDDLPLFNSLLTDLFPTIKVGDDDNQDLVKTCEDYLGRQYLQSSAGFMQKIMQLNSTLNVRFGTMVVGNAMVGKSTLIRTLGESINEICQRQEEAGIANPTFEKTSCVMINPKSVTMGELYGEENLLTKDWADGIASFYIRQATMSTDAGQKWICFDGPVDALWIENMNSVLDDSRLLCLSNGQRIRLKTDMRILFEVDTLEQASPATVSRCGMVFITEDALGWHSFVKSWLTKFSKKKNADGVLFISTETKTILETLFFTTYDSVIESFKNCVKPIETVIFQCIRTALSLLETYFGEDFGFKIGGNQEYKAKYAMVAFILSLAWGFEGCLQDDQAKIVDSLIKKKFPTFKFEGSLITDCFFDVEQVELKLYSEHIPPAEIDMKMPFWEIIVPTVETAKISSMLQMQLKSENHVFLTGSSGTGKSVVVSNVLKSMTGTQLFDSFKYNFSAQTNSKTLQDSIMSSLFLLSQKSRGARFGRNNIIFIDDVNMPAREEYGAQPPIELLRQVLDLSYVYDRKEMYKISIQDTRFVCLGAPPEGGRNPLSTRFVRHFTLLCLPKASRDTIFRIFSTIMDKFLGEFEDSVKALSHSLVNASTEIYEKISREKLPSPSKFFYTFNLRDLSKTYMGMMRASKVFIREGRQIIRLWAHETQRVFADRLNSKEDHDWFNETLSQIAKTYLPLKNDDTDMSQVIFTDLFTASEEEVIYEEVVDEKKLIKFLENMLEEFNDRNTTKMHLVFFNQAVNHILRTYRILRQSRGNPMLIGLGGLGKASLSKFASFLAGYPLISLESAKSLTGDKFKEWLRKTILLRCGGPDAGIDGAPLSFMIGESAINDENVFEDINSLLNTGEVPNIFPRDEREKLEKGLIDFYANVNINIDPSEVWKVFIERVRNNLHIILCMSPVGDILRIRCRRFPALVDCCTIDWFDNWPSSAIESVANKLLESQTLDEKEVVCQLFCEFHDSVVNFADNYMRETKRKYFVTPKSTLDNIELFSDLLKLKNKELEESSEVLKKGSVKLDEMSVVVAQLKVSLKEAQPLLEEQKTLAEQKLIELEVASKIANEKKEKVEYETGVIQVKTEQIELINNQASAQLSEAMPRIQKAENEVRNIDKKELNTLRHLNAPPAMIEFIFSTVCIALEEKYISWKGTGIKMLSDLPKFIEQLVDKIDKIKSQGSSAISAQSLNSLSRNLKNEFFSDAKLESNVIAKPLGLWCKAIYEFATLKKMIEPLEKNAKEMNEKLVEAKREYELIATELALCKQNFQKLQDEFNSMESKKRELQDSIQISKVKLGRAEKLTSLLADEGVRWKNTVLELEEKATCVVGDVFLSSAFISYMGPFSLQYRNKLSELWINIIKERCKISPNYSFLRSMGDPLKLRDWCFAGLPSDEISQSSALIATVSKKWPLMIDPQMQANIWIKNTFGDTLVILKSDKDKKGLKEKIKLAVSNGALVLFEDMDTSIDPLLDPVVNRLQFKNPIDQRVLISFGEDVVDYGEDFRLFMTSRISNPSFLPEIFIKTNVINFTVNQKGLEDQLLAEVMKLENPEVENSKNENIEKLSVYKKKMIEIEKQILKLLVECQNSPVEDENLVQTLEVSKSTSKEITEKLESIENIFKHIDETRNLYRSIAERGSILFFVVSDISNIDPMYQYSLQYIVKLFKAAIVGTTQTNEALRIGELISNITRNIYKNVSGGLFEQHKTIFSFLITVKLEMNRGNITPLKWESFLKGVGVIDRKDQIENPDPKLFNENNWDLVSVFQNTDSIWKILVDDFGNNLNFWKKFAESEEPFRLELPEYLESSIGLFDKLLLIKILKPDKLFFSLNAYIEANMGTFFIENLENNIEAIYKASDCFTPIIFIISQGSDPASIVKSLGEKYDFKIYHKLLPISLGQGQGKRASALITKGVEEGLWILLENCHLAKTWMPDLEQIIQDIQSQKMEVNPNFRLFLTSMPASYFPVSVLQNGIKVTTEPPRGLKANIFRSVSSMKDDFFENFKFKSAAGKMTLALCIFHAILQERRKFGPLGWNIRYEFNDSDLDAAKNIIQTFVADVTKKDEIPWESINFLIGLITYGGRITDDLDRRLLMTILSKFYTEQILDDRYKFCPLDDYKLPKVQDKSNCLAFAQSMPTFDDTEIFGLHKNANISFQTNEAKKLIDTIISIMPKNASAESNQDSATEKIKEKIDLFLNPENGLPQPLAADQGHKDLFKVEENGLIPTLSIVLFQEISRFNILIARIESSLKDLKLAVEGKSIMSADLDEVLSSITNNQVPKMWAEKAYPSLKPLASWFKDLRQRVAFMKDWLSVGKPRYFWLPGFFFPQGFLTGVLQTHARKTMMPIDKFLFTFKVTEFENDLSKVGAPEEGVYISGLFLEGASLDKKRKVIIDQAPNELYYSMPLIHFIPKESNDAKGHIYACPLYKTLNRAGTLSTTGQSTNFILDVQLPCDKIPEYWILRGVALFTQLND